MSEHMGVEESIGGDGTRRRNEEFAALAAERNALRAALDKAKAALREIAGRHIPTYPTDYEWMRDIANDHRRTANAALAQIEGGKK